MHSDAADERITYRYATAADICAYYGGQPTPTLQAVVVEQDLRLVAVFGIAHYGGYAVFFGDFHEEFRPYLREMTVLRAIKRAQQMARDSRSPVYAIADESEPDSRRLLSRLGFIHQYENIYRWDNS